MPEQEQLRMSFIDDLEQREIDRVTILQHNNLRREFDTILVKPILGKGYYNMGMCVYSCDKLAMEDLFYKFRKQKKDKILFSGLAFASLVINVILVICLLRLL